MKRWVGGLLGVVLAACVWPAAGAHAADEIHWTITGPSSVSFDWRGPESGIQFGLTTAYGQSAVAETPSPLPFSSSGPFWEARLTGLLPDTLYHYTIGGGPDHTFRTARGRGRSDFTVYVEGDIGSTATYWRVGGVQTVIANDLPSFTLMVGDLTYANNHGATDVDQHFNDVMAWSQDAAYMPAWGNHEYENDVYADDLRNYKGRVDLPNASASPGVGATSCCGEDWYWFDYGNVRFIAYPEPTPGAWADWYPKADSLMNLAQADKDIAFIVTFGHRPAYSSGNHPGSPSLKTYLDQLGLTHSKYKLNLNGHSHDYERSYPQNGVVHITAGTGGASLEEESDSTGCRWKGGCPAPEWSAFRAYHHGAVKLSFSSNAIKVESVCGPAGDSGANVNDITCTPGSVFDSVTIGIGTPESHIDSPASNVAIDVGESVTFAGTGEDPEQKGPLTYLWDFDGAAPPSTLEDPGPIVFPTAGLYRVRFTAIDADGVADPSPDLRLIRVGDFNLPPEGRIVEPATNLTITEGESVEFRGEASDADGDSVFSYAWDFDEGAPNVNVKDPGIVTFHTVGSFVVQLTVTDPRGLSDPTPAQIEITVADETPDGMIDAPVSDATIPMGGSVSFSGTGIDPDATMNLGYTWDFGGGAPTSHTEDPGPVTFPNPGVFHVTFYVADENGIVDPTPPIRTITVVDPNQPPNAVLHMQPATGNAPLITTADASASSDAEGRIVSYRFDFGDGAAAGPDTAGVHSHAYAAGSYVAAVTVTDAHGLSSTATVPVIVAAVTPGTNLVQNPSVESNLAGWAAYAGAMASRIQGGFDGAYAAELDGPATLATFGWNDSPNWVSQTPQSHVGLPYRFSAWVRSPRSKGRARIQVREFSGQTKIGNTTFSAYVPLSPAWQLVSVDHVVQQSGNTLDFQVLDYPSAPAETLIVDNVSIKAVGATTAVDPLEGAGAFAASLSPNPSHGSAVIGFRLPRPGFASIEVLDLSGRRVRALLARREFDPGIQRLSFDGRADDGSRLPSGIYFYRVATSFGDITHRFAILR